MQLSFSDSGGAWDTTQAKVITTTPQETLNTLASSFISPASSSAVTRETKVEVCFVDLTSGDLFVAQVKETEQTKQTQTETASSESVKPSTTDHKGEDQKTVSAFRIWVPKLSFISSVTTAGFWTHVLSSTPITLTVTETQVVVTQAEGVSSAALSPMQLLPSQRARETNVSDLTLCSVSFLYLWNSLQDEWRLVSNEELSRPLSSLSIPIPPRVMIELHHLVTPHTSMHTKVTYHVTCAHTQRAVHFASSE